MLRIDNTEIKALGRALRDTDERAFPFAVRQALNRTAYQAQAYARENIDNTMITRNKWTTGSVKVRGARGNDVRRMASAVGSVRGYLELQEFGGSKGASTKWGGVPVPTKGASGEGAPYSRTPRLKAVRPANRLRVTKIGRRQVAERGGNLGAVLFGAIDRGRTVVRIAKRGKKYGGIYRLKGGKRRMGKTRTRLKMVKLYSTRAQSIRVTPRPWLKPAFDEALPAMAAFYREAFIDQIKFIARRNKL